MKIKIIVNQQQITLNYLKMKKININHTNLFQLLLIVVLVILGTTKLNAQMKVGSNPKVLAPNSFLEVESKSGQAVVITRDSAFLGIGTLVPTRRLEIQNGNKPGAIKIVDGTQGAGKVLTSDSNGVAIWTTPYSPSPKNLTNSNGVIVTGGTGATYTDVSLRIDSSAIAKILTQSPSKDSLTSLLNNAGYDTTVDLWQNKDTSTFTMTGNVGIGINNPISKLEVKGAATNNTSVITSTATIDFTLSNLAATSSTATSITLSGIKDGGAYTLAFTSTAVSGEISFSATGYTFVYMGTITRTSGKRHIYSIIVIDTNAYVSMAVEN